MVDSVELKELTFQLSNSLDRGLNEFRYAAQNDNKNIRSIIKDIANMFSTQRRDISGINNAIEESMHVSEDQAERVSETNSLLNDSIALQGQIISELRNVAFNIRSLAENMGILLGNQGYIGTTLNAIKMGAVAAGLLSLPGDTDGGGGGSIPGGGSDYKISGGEKASGQKVVEGLQQRGFSKEESAAIAGNISAESGFRTDATNDIGAFGLMQWLGKRKQQLFEYAKSQGKSASDLNIQLDFIKKELKDGGHETEQFNRAVQESKGDVSKLAYLFGKYVERPSDSELAQSASRRMGVAKQLYSPSESDVSSKNQGNVSSEKQGSIPSNDIVALGKYLQGQGLRVSEHPAFGVVHKVHSPNSAHYSNRAIDVNIGENNVEANDPIMGKRFDELAQQLRKSGYRVIWRKHDHDDHMHVQVGGGTSSIYEPTEKEISNASKSNQTEVATPQSAPTPAYNEPPKINEKKRAAEIKEVMPMQKISSLNIPATNPDSAPAPIQNNNTSTINNSYIKSAEIQEHHEKAKFQQAMLETSNKNVENIQQAFHDTSKQGTPLPWEYNNDHDKNLGPSWPEMVSWSYPEISKKIRLSAFT